MTDGSGFSKRRSPRVIGPFKARWCGALTVPLVIHDLSVGGGLILSANMALPNKVMTLEIELPNGEVITVQGEPLYLRKGVGFVVRFVNVPDATNMRLKRLVTELAASAGKPTRK